ncbi:MAG: RNA 3'-terminal phosphate cyclase [Candidatus Aenigmatarchaeota archaeon]
MIEIDGSYGEGGGQILRTATSLAALTRNDVKISNIRGSRPNPGLKTQHLKGVETLAELCSAEMEGADIGSQKLTFCPGKVRSGKLDVDIGTAGSITLLLQSLMPLALSCDEEIELKIRGGTDVKWSPPIDYFKHVLLPLLENRGYEAKMEVKKRGFYPKGGGEVHFRAEPSELKKFDLTERGEIKKIKGISYASNHLRNASVAERQKKSARKRLEENFDLDIEIKTEYCDSLSPGSGIQLWLETEKSRIGGNALGEKGKASENVGKEAAEDLIRNSGGAVDRYAGDQLLVYLALAGGRIKPSEVAGHCKTNLWTIEKFIDGDLQNENGLVELI